MSNQPTFQLPRNYIPKKAERVYKKLASRIKNIAAYTATALARAPKRIKTIKPENKKVNNRNYFSIESELYTYRNGNPYRHNLSIAKYLKKQKEPYEITNRRPITLFNVLRKGADPGQVPKSWDGPGKTQYYISQRGSKFPSSTGKKQYINNWQIDEISEFEHRITLKPLGGKNSNFLRILEEGGTVRTSRFLKGYAMFKIRKKDKNRLFFKPLYEDPRTTTVQPRPFVNKTLEKVRKAKAI